MEKKNIRDIVFILILLAAAVTLFFLTKTDSSHGAYLEVSVNGETVGKIPLDKDGEYSLCGGSNILVVEDGCAYMKEANCPDHTCINMGKISMTGQKIICLPNKLAVIVCTDEQQGG